MKSDREFIDGIYKKAALIQREQASLKRTTEQGMKALRFNYRKLVPVFAMCILAMLIIPGYFMINQMILKPNSQEERLTAENAKVSRSTAPDTASPAGIAEQSDDTAAASDQIAIPDKFAVSLSNVAEGEITAVIVQEEITYLLVKTTGVTEGAVQDNALVECENSLLKPYDNSTLEIGGTAQFTLEEIPQEEFLFKYESAKEQNIKADETDSSDADAKKIRSELNKSSGEMIDKIIQSVQEGNGFIGYYRLKSIGDYHGI